ncbi:MAG: Smr/MutS family endonuclease [Gammaproteobacteria bacterium]|nr:Smr/MutS family endonuclease [Gammaproteobacteria bacterium]
MKKNKSDNILSDSELFREATSGTRPLKKTDKVAPTSNNKTNIRVKKQSEQEFDSYPLSDFVGELNTCTADEVLAYRGNGVQQRLFKKLRNGQITTESILDLHGLTVDQARTVLNQFLAECLQSQYRCVIIVHGKGSRGDQPILKPMLNNWLQQIPDILAFSSAQAQDGGTGALYVLLRNNRKTESFE